MKQLVLIRHAKAVPYGYDNDFMRELTDRGISDAGMIGRKLNETGINPGLVMSSPAPRAIATARIIAGLTGYQAMEIEEHSDIYLGLTTDEFIELIQNVSDDIETVFVIGHNPAFCDYATDLTPEFDEELPTCGTVGIRFAVETWKNVGAGKGLKAFFLFPKGLK